MKNISLTIVILLFVINSTNAQESLSKCFVGFTVGFAQPFLGDDNLYSTATTIDNTRIGMNGGTIFGATFGYDISSNFGMAVILNRTLFKANAHEYLARSWVVHNALAGPYYSVNSVNSKIDFRFLTGYTVLTTPVYRAPYKFISIINDAKGIAFQFGMGARVPLSQRLFFTVNADYYTANHTWELAEFEQKEKISAFTINFGIAGRACK